jgi:hypothetical protein
MARTRSGAELSTVDAHVSSLTTMAPIVSSVAPTVPHPIR